MSLSPRSSAGPDDGDECDVAPWLRGDLDAHAGVINVLASNFLSQQNLTTSVAMISRLDVYSQEFL
jgi:hypothetical protein